MFFSYIVALVLSAHLSVAAGAPMLHPFDAGGGPMTVQDAGGGPMSSSHSHGHEHTSDAGGGPMNGGPNG
jgi:hypothetical protein